jgi:hypothetical protein
MFAEFFRERNMQAVLSAVLVSLALAGCSGANPGGAVAQGDSTPAMPTPAQPAQKAAAGPGASEFGEAVTLLGVDPVPTIRARAESCVSGDRKAFASYYVPEMVAAFTTDSKILEYDFHGECGDVAVSRSDLDARFKAVKVFAKRTELLDLPAGNAIYRLCVTDKDAVDCARPGSRWTNSVVVRDGRVLFVD